MLGKKDSCWSVAATLFMIVVATYSLTSEALVEQAAPRKFLYRKAKRSDIPSITKLLVETFEESERATNNSQQTFDPFSINTLFASSQKKRLQRTYEENFERRWQDLVENPSVRHMWIVATSSPGDDDEGTPTIDGFMELGVMPPPFDVSDPSSPSNTPDASISVPAIGGATRDIGVVSSFNCIENLELPFLANLAVSRACRRQRVGSKLVQLALKIAPTWQSSDLEQTQSSDASSSKLFPSLFLSVDCDNQAAIQLYQGLQFEQLMDERDTLPPATFRKLQRPPRIYLGYKPNDKN